jgi:hypothetical protein
MRPLQPQHVLRLGVEDDRTDLESNRDRWPLAPAVLTVGRTGHARNTKRKCSGRTGDNYRTNAGRHERDNTCNIHGMQRNPAKRTHTFLIITLLIIILLIIRLLLLLLIIIIIILIRLIIITITINYYYQ